MSLPESRNRTYVDGTPVHPGDLNDIQDAIIGSKRGPFTRAHFATPGTEGDWAAIGNGQAGSSGAGSTWFEIGGGAAIQGDRLHKLRWQANGDGAVDVTYTIEKTNAFTNGTAPVVLGGPLADNNRNAWGDLEIVVDPPYTLIEGDIISLKAAASAAAAIVGPLVEDWDHP